MDYHLKPKMQIKVSFFFYYSYKWCCSVVLERDFLQIHLDQNKPPNARTIFVGLNFTISILDMGFLQSQTLCVRARENTQPNLILCSKLMVFTSQYLIKSISHCHQMQFIIHRRSRSSVLLWPPCSILYSVLCCHLVIVWRNCSWNVLIWSFPVIRYTYDILCT